MFSLVAKFSFRGRAVSTVQRSGPLAAMLGAACLLTAPGATWVMAARPCNAPKPVCAARATVFALSSKFDAYGSAVRLSKDLLVTNRHLLADETSAQIILPDGTSIIGTVLPTNYRGDLLMLRAKLPAGPVAQVNYDAVSGPLYTVGAGLGKARAIVVHDAGELTALPARNKPFARLHHTAYVERGNSGGALVDAMGRVVGITTSGGDGHYEAMPARHIALVQTGSGPTHGLTISPSPVGKAYRDCYDALDKLRRLPTKMRSEKQNGAMRKACVETHNRQMIDLAAQSLGRAREFDAATELFEQSLKMDPNAINTRLSLAITLSFAQNFADAKPHLRRLMALIPKDTGVQKMAVQAGKATKDKALINEALALIAKHDPRGLAAARSFLNAKPRPNRPVPNQSAPNQSRPQ